MRLPRRFGGAVTNYSYNKSIVFLSLLVIMIGLTIGFLIPSGVQAGKKPTPLKFSSGPGDHIKLIVLNNRHNTINIEASLKVKKDPFDQEFWWVLDLSKIAIGNIDEEIVWGPFEYPSTRIPKGNAFTLEFKEQLEIPSGTYRVRVGVREASPTHNGVELINYSEHEVTSQIIMVK